MPPINQPNPSDRNSRLRAQKDQEETLGKLVKNFGSIMDFAAQSSAMEDKKNTKNIIISNEDVTLLSAESIIKEVEKSSVVSTATMKDADKNIMKKHPVWSNRLALAINEQKFSLLGGFSDWFTNLISIFPNAAARKRSRKAIEVQIKEKNRAMVRTKAMILQTQFLSEIAAGSTKGTEEIREGKRKDEDRHQDLMKALGIGRKKDLLGAGLEKKSFLSKLMKILGLGGVLAAGGMIGGLFKSIFGAGSSLVGLLKSSAFLKSLLAIGGSGIRKFLPLLARGAPFMIAGALLANSVGQIIKDITEAKGFKEIAGNLIYGRGIGGQNVVNNALKFAGVGAVTGAAFGLPGIVIGALLGGAGGAILAWTKTESFRKASVGVAEFLGFIPEDVISKRGVDHKVLGAIERFNQSRLGQFPNLQNAIKNYDVINRTQLLREGALIQRVIDEVEATGGIDSLPKSLRAEYNTLINLNKSFQKEISRRKLTGKKVFQGKIIDSTDLGSDGELTPAGLIKQLDMARKVARFRGDTAKEAEISKQLAPLIAAEKEKLAGKIQDQRILSIREQTIKILNMQNLSIAEKQAMIANLLNNFNDLTKIQNPANKPQVIVVPPVVVPSQQQNQKPTTTIFSDTQTRDNRASWKRIQDRVSAVFPTN